MKKTPQGTSVGVDDPYEVVERCDHLTDDGRCRYAAEHGHQDPEFARKRRADDLRCPVVAPGGEAGAAPDEGETHDDPQTDGWDWRDCPQFQARQRSRECVRCGLEERRLAHDDDRPLLEEHHLEYRDDDRKETAHEITVYLCRWCHAKIHDSWARVDDDANPDPEALAEREARRSREREEAGFESAAERYDDG